jgi:tetratricopeptide (TPR) repeat protein
MPQRIIYLALIAAAALLLGCGSDAPSQNGGAAATQPDFDHPAMAPVDADADSVESLAQALEKNPEHTPILLRMAELALQSGDAKGAVEHLRKAVDIDPKSLDARLELGRALYQAGDAEGAIHETEALLQLDPNHVDALYNLGAIYANTGKPEQAVSYWTRAVQTDPQSPSGVNAQQGLQVLNGQARQIPDIPAHRGLQTSAIPDIPQHRGLTQPTGQFSPQQRNRLIEFAAETAPKR